MHLCQLLRQECIDSHQPTTTSWEHKRRAVFTLSDLKAGSGKWSQICVGCGSGSVISTQEAGESQEGLEWLLVIQGPSGYTAGRLACAPGTF